MYGADDECLRCQEELFPERMAAEAIVRTATAIM
jgi:hypothetical protein